MMADRLATGTSTRSDISKQIALAAVAIYAIIVLVAFFTVQLGSEPSGKIRRPMRRKPSFGPDIVY